MENLVFTQLSIPEIRQLFRQELEGYFKDTLSVSQTKPEPDELLTSTQAAKILQVSKVTLHKWKLDGKVKSYRIGTRIRFKHSEVLDALNGIKTIKSRS